jgi:polysaccharide deacetylase 2 family uncharacterized protein YibQ
MGEAERPQAVTSYRGLAVFWGVVLAGLAAGAATLQVMGPPPRVPYRGDAPARPSTGDEAAPASRSEPPAVASRPPADAATPAKPAAASVETASIPPPDPALLEPAPEYPGRSLPQIGPGNRAPMAVYAAPFNAADKHPRVALVIDGAGLDQDQTLHALADLPGPVDIAFSAYMPENLEDQFAARARQTGHECLQSVPMEPTGYPLSEEGARSLLTGADNEQNRQNLEWAISRLPGCVGATGASDGMLGERFAQTGQGFADLLAEMSKRGLLYLDTRTGAPALAAGAGPNVRVADMVVDQSPSSDTPATAEVIDQRLAALEHLALVRGSAIGIAGPPKPVLLERVAVWAHGLAARGVTLAPLTAIAGPAAPPPSMDTLPADSAN